MKTLFVRTTLGLALTAALSSLSYARTGPGSGNGDGDRAFALQKMAVANPNLTPQQVLLKAFEESAGRIPTMTFDDVAQGSSLTTTAFGEFIGMTRNDLKGIELAMKPSSKQAVVQLSPVAFTLMKSSSSMGPLFQNSDDEYGYILRDGVRSHGGTVNTCNNSLCFMAGDGGPWVEFRAYNEKIIIFVTRAAGAKSLACYPIESENLNPSYNPQKRTDVCSVGYIWAK